MSCTNTQKTTAAEPLPTAAKTKHQLLMERRQKLMLQKVATSPQSELKAAVQAAHQPAVTSKQLTSVQERTKWREPAASSPTELRDHRRTSASPSPAVQLKPSSSRPDLAGISNFEASSCFLIQGNSSLDAVAASRLTGNQSRQLDQFALLPPFQGGEEARNKEQGTSTKQLSQTSFSVKANLQEQAMNRLEESVTAHADWVHHGQIHRRGSIQPADERSRSFRTDERDLMHGDDDVIEEEEMHPHHRQRRENSNGIDLRCQRYEERIVELHSVIAELSRKLQGSDDVIEEEEEESEVDDVIGERHFESRDTPRKIPHFVEEFEEIEEEDEISGSGSKYEEEDEDFAYKIELFDAVHAELVEVKRENANLLDTIQVKDSELANAEECMAELRKERENLKRQLDDLQNTVEFQEAKMDEAAAKGGGSGGGGSGERRSVRKHKRPSDPRKATPPLPPLLPPAASRSVSRGGQQQQLDSNNPLAADCQKCTEIQLEVDKLAARCDNLTSQNSLLSLSLEEARSTSEKATVLLGKHQANVSAMTLANSYSDSMIEAYDVLVALLDTSTSTEMERHLAVDGGSSGSRQWRRRRSAVENVAKHLLSRIEKKTPQSPDAAAEESMTMTSGLGSATSNCFPISLDTTWDDHSSGYSHTTSSTTSATSTSTSSSHHRVPGKHHHDGSSSAVAAAPTTTSLTTKNVRELRIREHINHMKNVRASVQSTFVELEPITIKDLPHGDRAPLESSTRTRLPHSDSAPFDPSPRARLPHGDGLPFDSSTRTRLPHGDGAPFDTSTRARQLEEAVSKQEVMGMREECADLRAKLYLAEKESSSLQMSLQDRYSVEDILRTHIEHQQEELDRLMMTSQERPMTSQLLQDEAGQLRKRVDSLLETLDRVTRNSELRHKQADELVGDLKRANSTLSEALERSKRKYQAKVKKLEQKRAAMSAKACTGGGGCSSTQQQQQTSAPSSNQNSIKKT